LQDLECERSNSETLTHTLGNVRTIVGDVKLPTITGLYPSSPYTADVKNNLFLKKLALRSHFASSPYGWEIKLVGALADNKRYGYNGKERIPDINGEGVHTTAEFWEYDSRIGRRWNRDPNPIAEESEYAVNRNNLMYTNDPNGDNPIISVTIAAFTEYTGIIVSKMLFDDMSFTEANSALTWRDRLDISVTV
jgi:hypothetical protein